MVVAGAIGVVAGTLDGYELRRKLAAPIGGKARPIALLENAVAIGAASWIVALP